jgi:signal transduction histidine kinase
MDMMSLPGFRALAQDRARSISHSARAASIRYATVLGSVFAFVVLCVLSVRANAAPVVNEGAGAQYVREPRAVAALGSRDALATHVQPGETSYSRDATGVARDSEVISAAEAVPLQDQVAMGAHRAVVVWHGVLMSLLALAALTLVALGGWCRARVALKRAAEKLRGTESEWQRRYIAVEEREQAACAVAARQAAAAVQERERILTSMRHFVGGPLSALAGLFEALDSSSMSSSQRPVVGKIQSAVRTCARALEDMLAPAPVEARTVVLDENLTDLRELIDGVVALFSPAAAQKGLYLSVSIDRSVAARILADSARLGQIVFHLLSDAVRLTGRGQITVAARAESLNAGSQRIFIWVRDVSAAAAFPEAPIQVQLPCLFATGTPAEAASDHGDPNFALCQQLAHHMRGELTVRSEPGFGTSRMFSAPFAIEPQYSSVEPAHCDSRAAAQEPAAQPVEPPSAALAETFDPWYLVALSDEGIDLRAFARGWRKSMIDDLEQMRGVLDRGDIGGLRASLHRLSGAVGLVGARGLMEALRRASVVQPEPEAGAIDALAYRIEGLMKDLDIAIETQRSNLP